MKKTTIYYGIFANGITDPLACIKVVYGDKNKSKMFVTGSTDKFLPLDISTLKQEEENTVLLLDDDSHPLGIYPSTRLICTLKGDNGELINISIKNNYISQMPLKEVKRIFKTTK